MQRGLLDTASDLVEGVAGQLHDMEGVQDSGRVGQLVTSVDHVLLRSENDSMAALSAAELACPSSNHRVARPRTLDRP